MKKIVKEEEEILSRSDRDWLAYLEICAEEARYAIKKSKKITNKEQQ